MVPSDAGVAPTTIHLFSDPPWRTRVDTKGGRMPRKAAPAREPIARDVRTLPDAPSLEYERKEAKAHLKQIRAGKADALQRVQSVHPVSLRDRSPDQLKLADAQHVIAREYGFTSWPKLVEYFAEMERHRDSPRSHISEDSIEHLEQWARGIIRRHQRGDRSEERRVG